MYFFEKHQTITVLCTQTFYYDEIRIGKNTIKKLPELIASGKYRYVHRYFLSTYEIVRVNKKISYGNIIIVFKKYKKKILTFKI